MRLTVRRKAGLGAALLTALGACAAPPAPPAPVAATVTVVHPATLRPGTGIPAPAAAPVLAFTGRITRTNVAGTLSLDLATLDRLGVIATTVYDPWVKRELAVRGVWLADLVDLAQVEPAATSLHFTALDDYEIDLSLLDVRAGGILVAIRRGDGSAIPVSEGGPTRIVCVCGAVPGSRPELWIWSMKTIDVR